MFKIHELLVATGGRLTSGRKDAVVQGISIDSRTIKRGEAFIAIRGNNFDGNNFIDKAINKGASCVICALPTACRLRPKVAVIEVGDAVKALGDIARFHRDRFNIPVIAVTGSNGKTTTKDMIAWFLSTEFKVLKNEGTKNNHIGLPLTLLNLNPSHNIAVLELGTNHFGEIDYLAQICQASIGVITNIGPAHLDSFGSLQGVFREKYALISNLRKPCLAILNSDDAILRAQVNKASKKPFILGFGIKNPADFLASKANLLFNKLEFFVEKNKFTLKSNGYYNIYNALAAITVARIFGLEYKKIAKCAASFDFPSGRLKARYLKRVRFIDDTYNSNPASLKQALSALRNIKVKGRKILVMGDMLELGSNKKIFHTHAGFEAGRICDIVITVGGLAALAAEAAGRTGLNNKNIFVCNSNPQAREVLFNRVSPGEDDIVLVKGSRAMRMEEILK